MRRCIPIGCLLIASLFAVPLSAQSSVAADLAPHLDAQAMAVVRVELEPLHLEPTYDLLRERLPQLLPPQDDFAPMLGMLEQTRSALLATGVSGFSVIVGIEDIPIPGPLVIAHLTAEADDEAARDTLADLVDMVRPDWEVETGPGNTLLLGTREALDRSRVPEPRDGLGQALKAVEGHAIQCLVLPSRDHRRVLREMLPALPSEAGNLSGSQLADGMQWMAAGLRTPPETAVTLVVQSADADSAEAMHTSIVAVYGWLREQPQVRAAVPEIESLLATLTPEVDGDQLVLRLNGENGKVDDLLQGLQLPAAELQAAAHRNQAANNMKQLALAAHNYYSTYRSLPPRSLNDEDGQPLLSWRVAILPYLGHQALYERFHLDEPWDSEHNRALLSEMPEVFAKPGSDASEGKTVYVAPAGAHTVFPSGDPLSFRQITDGTSNTILYVEVDESQAVSWTRPQDWEVDPSSPHTGWFTDNHQQALAAFCDGSVESLTGVIADETLRRLLDPADGQPVDR